MSDNDVMLVSVLEACDYQLTGSSGFFNSTNYGPGQTYPDIYKLECWMITVRDGCTIDLSFSDLQTEDLWDWVNIPGIGQ